MRARLLCSCVLAPLLTACRVLDYVYARAAVLLCVTMSPSSYPLVLLLLAIFYRCYVVLSACAHCSANAAALLFVDPCVFSDDVDVMMC